VWVVYRAAVDGFGRCVETELGRLGGGDDDESRSSVARDDLGIGRRHAIGKEAGAVGVDHPGDRRPEVFDDERYAGEWAVGENAGRFVERGRGASLGNRVDDGIPFVDPMQRVRDRFAGGQVACADRRGESGGIELVQAIVDAAEYVTAAST
jgi:hypothetical protein